KLDEINLRQQAYRAPRPPPGREVERSSPTVRNEPVSQARLSTRPTHCDVRLARSTPPRAHRGNAVRLPPPKLAPRVVSHPVQLAPSGPTPRSRSGPGRGGPGTEPTADARDALGILHPTHRHPAASPTRPYPA